jgi:phospholipid-binding lipoprotein MlaA
MRPLPLACLALLLASCAARQPGETYDPFERVNRKVFWFNDQLDAYALEPLAKGWDYVAPDVVQRSIDRFFDNIDFPIIFTNDLLQWKLRDAGVTAARFAINTTAGLGGFFDPAADVGLRKKYEDFGQTLGVWGVEPGPYLVLPLLGPSSPRDAVGNVVDSPLRVYSFFAPFYVSVAATATRTLNLRSLFLEEIRTNKEAALDYYVFVRNAYEQRRRALINDSTDVEKEDEEDLYGVPEDEEGL